MGFVKKLFLGYYGPLGIFLCAIAVYFILRAVISIITGMIA